MPEATKPRIVAEPLLERLSDVLGARMGLHYPKARWADLERGIAAVARAMGMPDAPTCVKRLLSAPLTQEQVETLATHLTIGETYFFRERRTFEALETQIFPALLRERAAGGRRLRIWSAGCCTGEEPYSIAMLLARMVPNIAEWNVSILATDIDPQFLRKAAQAVYGTWSFRDVPAAVRARHFSRTADGRFELATQIRKMVTFAYLNLAEDVYPALDNGTNAMDLILCRNVLIYFEASRGRDVLRKLARCLVEGGWLLVAPAEVPHVALPDLVRVDLGGIVAHRKQTPDGQRLGADSFSDPRAPSIATPDRRAAGLRRVPTRAHSPRPPTIGVPAAARTTLVQPKATPYSRAAALYAEGRYAEAVTALVDLLGRDRDNAAAMTLLARAHANQGRLDEALAWCERALAADKMNPACWFLRATISQELDRGDEAADALRRALYLDPDHALAHFAFANLMRRRGNAREAERHLRNALSALTTLEAGRILPESEGMTAGRLAEIIRSTLSDEARA